jgi:hypothetical protein
MADRSLKRRGRGSRGNPSSYPVVSRNKRSVILRLRFMKHSLCFLSVESLMQPKNNWRRCGPVLPSRVESSRCQMRVSYLIT